MKIQYVNFFEHVAKAVLRGKILVISAWIGNEKILNERFQLLLYEAPMKNEYISMY